jgi:hypothetical protein
MVNKTPKRPRDFSQAAKFVVDVATGQVEDRDLPVSSAAKHGQEGGMRRARNLSPEQRRAIAKNAAKTRWGKGRAARVKKEPA